MRNLNNKDLFTIMKIIRKTGMKTKLLELDVPKDKNGNMILDDAQYGIVLLMEFLESAPNAQDDVFAFLADVGGVDQKELEEDEFELLQDIVQHLMNQKKLINFLSTAFKSTT